MIDSIRNINLDLLYEDTESFSGKMSLDLDTVYKALRLVPEFDGNPNVLTRFIQLCDHLVKEYYNVQGGSELINSALINGILNKIVGSAARLINSNGIASDWNGIRKALVNNFADQRDETALYSDLSLLTQGSSNPQEFYERCQNLFSTIMTYVSLHDTLKTTIDAKRDLYKKLTLQAFVRGLKDPVGSRVRCMRPQSIEQALEFVHEETNTMYLQNRNDRLPDKRNNDNNQPGNHFKLLSQPFNIPPRSNNYSMPGPSRFQFPAQQPAQWKPIYFQPRQFGPTRTQQIFRAPPPNYNRQNDPVQVGQQNSPNQPSGSGQPRPMSGVSHFVSRQLPPTNAFPRHDWSKSGNPPPSNYFKTREMHFSDCYNDPSFNDYFTNYDGVYYDFYEYPDLYYEYQPLPQECLDFPQQSESVKKDAIESKEQDFQKTPKSEKLK